MGGVTTGDGAVRGERPSLAALLIAAGVGVGAFLDGRYVAYLNTRPTSFARFDVLLLVLATVIAAVVLGVAARRLRHRWPMVAARRPMTATLALVALGFTTGAATAVTTGAQYQEPPVQQAESKAAGNLTGVLGFEEHGDRPATCRSVPGGTDVQSIDAYDLGSLDGVTLRTSLSISPERTVDGDIYVDGADVSESTGMPAWSGVLMVTDMTSNGRSGVVTFSDLRLVEDPPPGVHPNGSPWPASLAGSIRWACGG